MEKSATAPFIMEKVARPLETIAQAPSWPPESGRILSRSGFGPPHPPPRSGGCIACRHAFAGVAGDGHGLGDAATPLVAAAGVIVMCTVRITNNKQRGSCAVHNNPQRRTACLLCGCQCCNLCWFHVEFGGL